MAVINYIWDELSDNVQMETDENNVPTAIYTHRPERFGELISQERSGVTSYYHYDGAHSTRLLTDDSENITDTYIFSAFGELVARTGTTINPFGYKGAVGYYTNAATNDIYVRARTYEPVTGRWLSMDPLGFVDGPNLYRAYFMPGSVDPSGLVAICCDCAGGPRSGPATMSNYGDDFFVARTDCQSDYSNCCRDACRRQHRWASFRGSWRICSAGPDGPPPIGVDPCPSDWATGTDYLTCLACCVRTYEFWSAGEIASGIVGIRVPKPHIQPGQYPTQTWLYGPRRCLPRWCRPTIRTVRFIGKWSGILFIVEGCYDVGVEGSCAAYCAAR